MNDLPPLAVDPEQVRAHMRRWATGVTVVSSLFDGVRHGMTVSSFTSISLDPPIILISLASQARTHRLIEQSGVFGVTILDRGQQDISDRFAGRMSEDEDRFAGLETFTLATGASFLAGGLSFFDCQVRAAYVSGDNTIFLGEVVAVDGAEFGEPLIYYNRSYHGLV